MDVSKQSRSMDDGNRANVPFTPNSVKNLRRARVGILRLPMVDPDRSGAIHGQKAMREETHD